MRRLLALLMCAVLPMALTGFGIRASAQAAPRPYTAGFAAAPGQYFGTRVRLLNGTSLAAGATQTVKVAGVGDLPASGLGTVTLNLAVSGAAGSGGVVPYPSELTAAPAVTGAPFHKGVWDDTVLTVKVGADGSVKLKNTGTGAATVYADVHGCTRATAGTPGATYVPLPTARIVSGLTVPAKGTLTFAVAGTGGIPTANVAHVAATLVTKSTGSGRLFAYASGAAQPSGANLDYRPSSPLSNHAVIPVGADGKVTVSNDGAQAATLYVDSSGYYVSPQALAEGSRTTPVTPTRIVSAVNIAAGASSTIAPLGKGGIPSAGVSGVGANLTAKSTAAGQLRVYPNGQASVPAGGAQSYLANDYYASFTQVRLGKNGQFTVKNTGSVTVTLWVDVFAYYGQPPATDVAVDASGAPDGTGQAGQNETALSRDGRYLFFFTYDGSNLAPASVFTSGGTTKYLLRRDLTTGETIVASRAADGVTPAPADDYAFTEDVLREIAADKDGSVVAYIARPPGGGDYEIRATDLVHNTTRIVQSQFCHDDPDLAISDDGGTVAYTWCALSSDNRLLHTVMRRHLDDPAQQVDTCALGSGCATWGYLDMSGDGTRIAYPESDGQDTGGGQLHMMLYDSTSGSTTDLTDPIDRTADEWFNYPVLSKDGSTIGARYSSIGYYGDVWKRLDGTRTQKSNTVMGDANGLGWIYPEAMSRDGGAYAFLFGATTPGTHGYVYRAADASTVGLPGVTSQGEINMDVPDDGSFVIWHRTTQFSDIVNGHPQAGVWMTRVS
ncbi:hypothetical protein AB0L06_04110 [Spirillospora sp. NPDC052269]